MKDPKAHKRFYLFCATLFFIIGVYSLSTVGGSSSFTLGYIFIMLGFLWIAVAYRLVPKK